MLFEKTFFVVGWKKSIGGPWIVFWWDITALAIDYR